MPGVDKSKLPKQAWRTVIDEIDRLAAKVWTREDRAEDHGVTAASVERFRARFATVAPLVEAYETEPRCTNVLRTFAEHGFGFTAAVFMLLVSEQQHDGLYSNECFHRNDRERMRFADESWRRFPDCWEAELASNPADWGPPSTRSSR